MLSKGSTSGRFPVERADDSDAIDSVGECATDELALECRMTPAADPDLEVLHVPAGPVAPVAGYRPVILLALDAAPVDVDVPFAESLDGVTTNPSNR